MIFCINRDGEYEYPLSFDELRRRFPNTSFCTPLQQSALPEGYYLASPTTEDFPVEKNKKTLPTNLHQVDGSWFYDHTPTEVSQKELQKQIDHVDNQVANKMSMIHWALGDDVPENTRNKYIEIKKQILSVYDQDGYPFHIKFSEIK